MTARVTRRNFVLGSVAATGALSLIGRRGIAAERIGARLAVAISTGVAGLMVLFNLIVYAT